MPAMMHEVMGRLSWSVLSDSDKEGWGLSPQIPDCAPEFLRKLPQTASIEDKMAIYSKFLDLMGWRTEDVMKAPEYLLCGKFPVPHGATDQNFGPCWGGESMFDVEGWRAVLQQFVTAMVNEVRKGDMEQAALFGGLLAHFVQDGSAIGHLFPNRLFYDFFPDEKHRFVQYHTLTDACDPELESCKPLLLGTTVEEFIFRLSILGERNYVAAKEAFFPMLQACQVEDKITMNRLAKPLRQAAVLQVASLFHTALALGRGRIDPAEAEPLAEFDITRAPAYYIHPGQGYGPVLTVNHTIDDGKKVPLRVDFGGGSQTVETGLGMTSFTSYRYLLEGGAFRKAEGQVALSSDYTRDQEPDMDVEFFVGLDPDWNRVVSGHLSYGPSMRKAFTIRLKPNQPPEKFSVELGNARTLLFGVVPHPPPNWRETCWFPHVVVAGPVMVK